MLQKLFLFSTVAFLALYVYLVLEEGRELKVWENSPSTLNLYSTPQVCVEDEETNAITTLASDSELSNTSHILNCGPCGKCSNRHDIQVYQDTRHTLTTIATQCTVQALFRGLDIDYVKHCLIQDSKMSVPCVDCWIINVQCNWDNCFKTCIKHKVFPWLPSLYHRSHESPLDPCIECDERMCGPAFLECAGANRRRVGVVSDLQRNANLEICDKADWDYIESRNKNQETTIRSDSSSSSSEL